MKYFLLLVATIVISGCASIFSGGGCDKGDVDGDGVPCWVYHSPDDGVVVNMSEHIDPNKTREVLFKKALLEIAAAKTGVSVSEDSIVKKQTNVTGSDNVSQQVKVVTLATVKTQNGSVNVKAKIKDEWKHPSSRKLFLWVIPTD